MVRRLAAALLLCAMAAACQATAPSAGGAILPRGAGTPPPSFADHPPQDADDDARLRAQVLEKLEQMNRTAYRGVSVSVWNGCVLLMGAVPRPDQRRHAERAAAAVPGTVRVLNELILAEDRALDLFVPDGGRETLLRRQLNLPEDRMAVRVVNGVAFLLGDLDNSAEIDAMTADVGEVEGIKWVVAHLDAHVRR